MTKCNVHENFFDWNCIDCKEEYKDLKGTNSVDEKSQIKCRGDDKADKRNGDYKEFTEERAKKLYQEIFLHTTINKYPNTAPTTASTQSDIGNSLEGKNKHSKEISECFDRAFGIDNYLSDSEIIECAKDRDSFK